MIHSTFAFLLSIIPFVIVLASLYYILKRAVSPQKTAANFVNQHLTDMTARAFFQQEKFATFRDLVQAKKNIAAAKEYQSVTHASLDESRLAVRILADSTF